MTKYKMVAALFLLNALRQGLSGPDAERANSTVRRLILELVRLQCQEPARNGVHRRANFEEPGKIPHRVNHPDVGYDCLDCTPLFVRLVSDFADYLNNTDSSSRAAYRLLLQRVNNYHGRQLNVAEAVVDALTWVNVALQASKLEAVEARALTYDALLGAAELFGRDQLLAHAARVSDRQVASWHHQAVKLQKTVLRDITLSPGPDELHPLNSRLFEKLEDRPRQAGLKAIVRQAISDERLTDGVRPALETDQLWRSHWVAMGLRRQSFSKLADEIDNRIWNTLEAPDHSSTLNSAMLIDIRTTMSKARRAGMLGRWPADFQKEMLLKIRHVPLNSRPANLRPAAVR